MSADAWPQSLTFKRGDACLNVRFDDGTDISIPYQNLRENAPSADVQGHGSGPKPPQAPVPADITVEKAEPVGRYAIRIHFSDGHSHGLYRWDYLRQLGQAT